MPQDFQKSKKYKSHLARNECHLVFTVFVLYPLSPHDTEAGFLLGDGGQYENKCT